MSQWGEERIFRSANASITVLPDVDTGGAFDPINPQHKIWKIFVTDSRGNLEEISQLTEQAKQFVGRPYGEWLHEHQKGIAERDYQKRSELQRIRSGTELTARVVHPAGVNAMPPCIIRQAGDSTWCAKPGCGLRWDTNDPEPPLCPRWAVAQRRKEFRVGEAQRRLSDLYSEPRERLWRILDVGGKIALAVTLAVVAAYVGMTWFAPDLLVDIDSAWFSR